MSDVTKRVSDYIKDKGISIRSLSDGSGVSYNPLYSSISGKRRLRADEFLSICDFLEISPDRFWDGAKPSDRR